MDVGSGLQELGMILNISLGFLIQMRSKRNMTLIVIILQRGLKI